LRLWWTTYGVALSEKELLAVDAGLSIVDPVRPLLSPLSGQTVHSRHSNNMMMCSILKMFQESASSPPSYTTGYHREENAIAALEVMSRFATNPRWLIYLPPTMSPCETSQEAGRLEHPADAFAYYQRAGIEQVICEEKHMGSRAVVIVCRDEEAVREHFGVLTRWHWRLLYTYRSALLR